MSRSVLWEGLLSPLFHFLWGLADLLKRRFRLKKYLHWPFVRWVRVTVNLAVYHNPAPSHQIRPEVLLLGRFLPPPPHRVFFEFFSEAVVHDNG